MHLVLGLGNPGRRYAGTRHNAGFLVVDRLSERWGAPCDRKQFGALVGKGLFAGRPVMLAKPQTYMNLSGQAAASLRGYYKLETDQLVVVHDEVDLPFGQVRVKRGGGHGGHRGLTDLHRMLGGGGYDRVRFGLSRPPAGWDTADYVLGKWTAEEQERLDELVERAADAVEAVIRDGTVAAMNVFNTRPRERAEGKEPPPSKQRDPGDPDPARADGVP